MSFLDLNKVKEKMNCLHYRANLDGKRYSQGDTPASDCEKLSHLNDAEAQNAGKTGLLNAHSDSKGPGSCSEQLLGS